MYVCRSAPLLLSGRLASRFSRISTTSSGGGRFRTCPAFWRALCGGTASNSAPPLPLSSLLVQ